MRTIIHTKPILRSLKLLERNSLLWNILNIRNCVLMKYTPGILSQCGLYFGLLYRLSELLLVIVKSEKST